MFGNKQQKQLTPFEQAEALYKRVKKEIKASGASKSVIDTPKQYCKRHHYVYANIGAWYAPYENELLWVEKQLPCGRE